MAPRLLVGHVVVAAQRGCRRSCREQVPGGKSHASQGRLSLRCDRQPCKKCPVNSRTCEFGFGRKVRTSSMYSRFISL